MYATYLLGLSVVLLSRVTSGLSFEVSFKISGPDDFWSSTSAGEKHCRWKRLQRVKLVFVASWHSAYVACRKMSLGYPFIAFHCWLTWVAELLRSWHRDMLWAVDGGHVHKKAVEMMILFQDFQAPLWKWTIEHIWTALRPELHQET